MTSTGLQESCPRNHPPVPPDLSLGSRTTPLPCLRTLSARFRRGPGGRGGDHTVGIPAPRPHAHPAHSPRNGVTPLPAQSRRERLKARARRVGCHQEFPKLRSLSPQPGALGFWPGCLGPTGQKNQVTLRPRELSRVWLGGRARGKPGGEAPGPLRLGRPPGSTLDREPASSLLPAFPRRPGYAQRRHLNRPLGTAAWRGRKGGGSDGLPAAAGPAGPGSGSGQGGHSPARVVVEVLQHRVAEKGPGGTLEAHGALRVQIVGARGTPRGHQRQEQRAEPPGAPPRRRAAHHQPAAALPCAPRAGRRACRRRGRWVRRRPGGSWGLEFCPRTRARRGAGPGTVGRAAAAGEHRGGQELAASSVRPRSVRARNKRVPGRSALDCGEARPRGGRPGRQAAGRRGSALCGPRVPTASRGRGAAWRPARAPHVPVQIAPWALGP